MSRALAVLLAFLAAVGLACAPRQQAETEAIPDWRTPWERFVEDVIEPDTKSYKADPEVWKWCGGWRPPRVFVDLACFDGMFNGEFWLAHEYGHFVLHYFNSPSGSEEQANCVAAAVTGINDPYLLDQIDLEQSGKYLAWMEEQIARGYVVPTPECIESWRTRMVQRGIL